MNYRRWVHILWLAPLIAGLFISCGTGASPSSEKSGAVIPFSDSDDDAPDLTCSDIIYLMVTYAGCEAICYSGDVDATECDAGCQEDFMNDYVDSFYGNGGCVDDLLATGGTQEEFFDCFATYCGECFSNCSEELYSCVSDAPSCFYAYGDCLTNSCDS